MKPAGLHRDKVKSLSLKQHNIPSYPYLSVKRDVLFRNLCAIGWRHCCATDLVVKGLHICLNMVKSQKELVDQDVTHVFLSCSVIAFCHSM